MAVGGTSPSPAAASAVPVQVRCAGCRGVLAVAPGMTEFICPKCCMAQRLPRELMPPSPPKASPTLPPPPPPSRRSAPPKQGVDPSKIQLPCARCKAILNVPYGLARFRYPQCDADLAVDLFKLRHFLASAGLGFVPPPPPPPPVPMPHMTFLPMMPHLPVPMVPPAELPEEINEVAVDVEREEDECGTVRETFIDYDFWQPASYRYQPPTGISTSSGFWILGCLTHGALLAALFYRRCTTDRSFPLSSAR